ncbi:hypothetical protein BRC89_09505 [Halobacteriales archaeon QS_4_70_19]|nr:MAG: hypothetical protein BRC89_09505 [Halobacteriales archaeon QS_4_70_19]
MAGAPGSPPARREPTPESDQVSRPRTCAETYDRILLAALEEESDEALAAVRKRGREADVDVVTSIRRGTPHDCITTCATDRGVGLVAMGAHGNRGLDRFLTANTAERVVRTAPYSDAPPVAAGVTVGGPSRGDGFSRRASNPRVVAMMRVTPTEPLLTRTSH